MIIVPSPGKPLGSTQTVTIDRNEVFAVRESVSATELLPSVY